METTPKFIYQPNVYNLNASNQVVPILMEMFQPKSVLDVGCGIGTWLKSFSDFNFIDIKGIDGDYVDREQLKSHINLSHFEPLDLSFPFNLERKFDLVLSLEVAEHLPETSAQSFIESLCKHGDIIVFSAAIPGQGGQNHINEQLKGYWINKFNTFNFEPYDLLRPKIWNNLEIDWWYKQNTIVFSNKNLEHLLSTNNSILEVIHPDLFYQNLNYISYLQQYVNELETKIFDQEKIIKNL